MILLLIIRRNGIRKRIKEDKYYFTKNMKNMGNFPIFLLLNSSLTTYPGKHLNTTTKQINTKKEVKNIAS